MAIGIAALGQLNALSRQSDLGTRVGRFKNLFLGEGTMFAQDRGDTVRFSLKFDKPLGVTLDKLQQQWGNKGQLAARMNLSVDASPWNEMEPGGVERLFDLKRGDTTSVDIPKSALKAAQYTSDRGYVSGLRASLHSVIGYPAFPQTMEYLGGKVDVYNKDQSTDRHFESFFPLDPSVYR
jgi:hypothetical protein